jgi:hypothetical protein
MTTTTTTERDNALEQLRSYFPAGSRVATILRSVSRSGLTRSISVVAVADGAPIDVSYLLERAGMGKLDRNCRGIVVRGAGMDMGWDLVYRLSLAIHGDGYALKQDWL